MWVLFLFSIHFSGYSSASHSVATTSHEFQSKESCVHAATALKTRKYVVDAYCVKK